MCRCEVRRAHQMLLIGRNKRLQLSRLNPQPIEPSRVASCHGSLHDCRGGSSWVLHHGLLLDLLVNAVVPVFDEFIYFELAGAHTLKLIRLLRMHFLNRFEHILADAVVPVLVLDVFWHLLIFKSLYMHEIAKVTTRASLRSVKVTALHGFAVVVLDQFRIQLVYQSLLRIIVELGSGGVVGALLKLLHLLLLLTMHHGLLLLFLCIFFRESSYEGLE